MERLFFPPATARLAAIFLAGLFTIAQAGCDESIQPVSGTNNLGPQGPEESFQRVLGRLKRRLEQGPRRIISSGLDADANELSSFTLQDTVTGEVVPPKVEGEPHRALVMIRTSAGFSYTRTIEEKPDETATESSDLDEMLSQAEEGGDGAVATDALLNPDLSQTDEPEVGAATDTTAAQAKPGTRTQTEPYSELQRFELIYRDGRWELVEPVGEDREALAAIFKYALDGQ